MRELLVQFLARLQATDRQQRLYIGLGVVLTLLALRYGAAMVGDFSSGMKSDIQLSARRLANARVLLAQADVVRERVEALRGSYQKVVAGLVPGATPTLAAAALQDRVSDLARANNVRIQSTQVLKEESRGPFTAVALRITAQAGIGNLAKFLGTLEAETPRVRIEFAEMSRRKTSSRRRARAQKDLPARVISATFQINAISQASTLPEGVVPLQPAPVADEVTAPLPARAPLPDNPLGSSTNPPEGGA
ncbi:MAG: type II secretion system protein GspM [Candidatus Binatia bacterium]|jgi:hypothetical protein|nr:type II secretion system protein GspM [Candidatus Binatia bacterium]MDG2011833.1 type II secretion system protein GspM [Candidatus Binatia bacterium]